jgi:hypothetical protein
MRVKGPIIMNANTIAPAAPPAAPRFDAKFIEEHHLIERYLDHKLPVKGARDLEHWCRDNPGYLDGLKLADRAQATLQLLEASGRPLDLSEPKTPWWKAPWVPIVLAAVTAFSLLGSAALYGKLMVIHTELEDTRSRIERGSLVQPATQTDLHVAPDHAPGIDKARITVSRSKPELIDLHVDLGYSKAQQFRLIVDKQDQGRALLLNNVLKDSNGELRLTINTTGLAAGRYTARIEALPSRGTAAPIPEGWMLLDVR